MMTHLQEVHITPSFDLHPEQIAIRRECSC